MKFTVTFTLCCEKFPSQMQGFLRETFKTGNLNIVIVTISVENNILKCLLYIFFYKRSLIR